jgi:hypothetical protein
LRRVAGLIRWSQALSQIRTRLSAPIAGEVRAASDEPLDPDDNHDRLPIWRASLRLIGGTCDVFGARRYVVRQATLLVDDLPKELRGKGPSEYHGFDHDADIDAFTESTGSSTRRSRPTESSTRPRSRAVPSTPTTTSIRRGSGRTKSRRSLLIRWSRNPQTAEMARSAIGAGYRAGPQTRFAVPGRQTGHGAPRARVYWSFAANERTLTQATVAGSSKPLSGAGHPRGIAFSGNGVRKTVV